MKLHRIIVHELRKNSQEFSVSLDQSSDLLPQNDMALDMVAELDKRYSTLSQTYASFDEEPQNDFPKHLKNYLLNDGDDPFVKFSQNCISILEQTIKVIYQAKGGYIIFVEYESKHRHIGVFLVRNKKAKLLNKTPNSKSFQLTETLSLDVENLAMAGRINITLLTTNTRYITFINKKNEDSAYFLKWFCAADRHTNKEDTKVFRDIIQNIPLPKDENGNESIDRDGFVKSVLNHIRNHPNKIVDLRSMGESLFNDSEYFVNYAEQTEKYLNHEFKPHADELKKMHTVHVNADKIILNFPLNYLKDNRVLLDETNGKIVITSASLLKKIISEKQQFNSGFDE